uniref:Uncharacterized protein n=1 Tax=Sipha flava TaxID=143950 RepID=A0A2S2PXT3_9HEMI
MPGVTTDVALENRPTSAQRPIAVARSENAAASRDVVDGAIGPQRGADTDAVAVPSLCRCDYPQPPDADLITVGSSSGVQHRRGRGGPKTTTRPWGRSFWKRSTELVRYCMTRVKRRVCFCSGAP